MSYETEIDQTDFGEVVDYLQHEESPIKFVLHVSNRKMLSRIAEKLARIVRSNPPSTLVGETLIKTLGEEGTLLLSPREPFVAPVSNHVIAASSIPRNAACEAIFFPPCYLVHTPGLFEGTLIGNAVALRSQTYKQKPQGIRIKP